MCLEQFVTKDARSLDTSTEAAISKMAGNGMHLPSAAYACLIAMLCLSPVKPGR